jgi:hypothetical protein
VASLEPLEDASSIPSATARIISGGTLLPQLRPLLREPALEDEVVRERAEPLDLEQRERRR